VKIRILVVAVVALLGMPGLAFAQSPVLVKGQPPLTEETVGRLTEFFEWAFDVYLTNDQRQILRDYAIDVWTQRRAGDINDILEPVKQQIELSKLDARQRAFVRVKIEPELLDLMRKQPNDPMAQWALAVYESSHRPIAPGNPPLTRQSTDAFLDALFFEVGVVAGEHAVPDQKLKDDWANALAANYPRMSAALKQQIAGLPLFMATMRVAWPQLSESVKAQYRAQWAEELKPLLPAAPPEASPSRPASSAGRSSVAQAMAEQNRRHQAYMNMSNAMMNAYKTNFNTQANFIGGAYQYR
jgi:hypothetical protein